TIATTVEGRERYPISVRYARDFREDLDALKRVLVPVPASERGASERMSASTLSRSDAPTQIPIGMLADISYKTGPPSIRNENGQLVGFVFVDITTDDLEGYVKAASQRIGESVQFPPGYYLQWAGQFEYLKSAEQRLRIVFHFTLMIIFIFIYINIRSSVKTIIVLLAVPFLIVKFFCFLYFFYFFICISFWFFLFF